VPSGRARSPCYCPSALNKRLRKKKRVGEFQELGFEVRGELRPGVAGAQLDAFVDRFLAQVEARQLGFARMARSS
jgi:uncharacterized protein YggL (DUF469 family)